MDEGQFMEALVKKMTEVVRKTVGEMCESLGLDGALDLTIEEMMFELSERNFYLDVEFGGGFQEGIIYILDVSRSKLLSLAFVKTVLESEHVKIQVRTMAQEAIDKINEDEQFKRWVTENEII